MQLLFAALLSMGITVLLIPPLMHWAGKLGVLDQPGTRKVHAKPIPRVGGIAMAAGMLVAMLVWDSNNVQLRAYLLALVVLLAFGIQDDRLTLSPTWKLIGQVLAALIVMSLGHINIGILRHVDAYELPMWLSMPITLFFIVGVTNAINLADGLDGLAGGTTMLCFSGLLLLALSSGSLDVAFVCMVTVGAVVGFLRYNTHPARIFMGDAGSQVLGFSAAVFSLVLTQDRDLPFSAALPLLLLGVPVIDTLTVMTERVLDGRSPFQADRTHVHHRLLSLGFDHHEAVMVIYSVQALLLVLAWYLRFASDITIIIAFSCVSIGIVTLLRQARLRGWQWRVASPGEPKQSWLRMQIRWLKQNERLNRWVGYLIGTAIVSYAVLLIINGAAVPQDIRVLAGASAVVVLISVLIHRAGTQAGWLERAALYISALIAVSLDRPGSLNDDLKFAIELGIFLSLTAAIVIRLQLSADRRFRVTPLDVLVLLIAVALPNLPGSVISGYAAGWMVAKVLVLLYGIENLSVSTGIQWRILTGGTLLFLAAVTTGLTI
jgi:UDP-GlcNAc:undecaprenyl-phosphate/decaprenyl-phosphate GlcNAc-1-phosphate transferase